MEMLACCGGEEIEGVCGVLVGQNAAGKEASEDVGMAPREWFHTVTVDVLEVLITSGDGK